MRVHLGNHRAVLPSIRADDRLVDGDLDLELADLEPGAGGDASAAPTQGGLRHAPLAGVRAHRGLGGLCAAVALRAQAFRPRVDAPRAPLSGGRPQPRNRRGGGRHARAGGPVGLNSGRRAGVPFDHVAREPGHRNRLRSFQPWIHGHGTRLFPVRRLDAAPVRPCPLRVWRAAGSDVLHLRRIARGGPHRAPPGRPFCSRSRLAKRRRYRGEQSLGEAVRRFSGDAARVYPITRHGVPASQHPAPGFGRPRAHKRRNPPDQSDRARNPGCRRYGRDLRPVDPAQCVRVEFRHHVHHARHLRQAADRRPLL